ncbi:MAG TPA: lysylphosphatidylglycerol synthase domain-containing protein [bacterium]
MSKIIKKTFQILVILTIFIFLIRNLILNWIKIPFKDLHFNPFMLFLSYIFLTIHFIIYVFSWKALLKKLNVIVGFANSFWMIATSQIAKYLPGGIWYAVGRIYLAKKEKLAGENTTISVILETCLIMIAGIVIFFLLLLTKSVNIKINVIYIIIVLLISLVLLHPYLLTVIINIFLKLIKKPTVKFNISYWSLIKLSSFFLSFWIAQILGFYFLICSIYPLPLTMIFAVAVAYILSWTIGFIAIFAPGGLGIREGTMTLYLSTIMPLPVAIAISLISRIWITVFEVIVFFMGLIIQKNTKKRANTE